MRLPDCRPIGPPEFVASLGLLALLAAVAVLALLLDGNRPKALRVGLAALTYLLTLAARGIAAGLGSAAGGGAGRAGAVAALPSIRVFLLAGGGAGFVSGIVRPEITAPVVVVQTLAAALLLGGSHWWAVRMWRRALGWITG